MSRRRARLVALLLAVLALAGCKVDVRVGVEAAPDGSGSVRVEVTADREVLERVDLTTQLQVEDLRAAGWTVEGPQARPGGAAAVVATKAFDDPAGAARVLAEVSGSDGPLQGFRIEREEGFLRTTTRFRGRVDLSEGIDAFGDQAVQAALGGGPLGIDQQRLAEAAGGSPDDLLGVQVAVRLPGTVTSNAPVAAADGATWSPRLREAVDLQAEGTSTNTSAVVLLGVAGIAAAVVLVTVPLVVVRKVRRRRAGAR